MPLFCDFYRLGHEDGRACALQIIFDLLFLYGRDYFSQTAAMEVVSSALCDEEETIQNIAAEGFSKLFLHRVVSDEAILEGLFQLYFHPMTSGPLKQCLSYFFQAFAFTSPGNQLIICGLVGRVLGTWAKSHGSSGGGLSVSAVNAQLSYLSDPHNLIQKAKIPTTDYAIKHSQTAIDLCWAILGSLSEEAVKKTLLPILGKLPLSPVPPGRSELKRLFFLLRQLQLYVADKNSANTVGRLLSTVIGLQGEDDEPLDPEALAEMKTELQRVLPATAAAVALQASTAAAAQPALKKAKTANSRKSTTENIMDEISDLLE